MFIPISEPVGKLMNLGNFSTGVLEDFEHFFNFLLVLCSGDFEFEFVNCDENGIRGVGCFCVDVLLIDDEVGLSFLRTFEFVFFHMLIK